MLSANIASTTGVAASSSRQSQIVGWDGDAGNLPHQVQEDPKRVGQERFPLRWRPKVANGPAVRRTRGRRGLRKRGGSSLPRRRRNAASGAKPRRGERSRGASPKVTRRLTPRVELIACQRASIEIEGDEDVTGEEWPRGGLESVSRSDRRFFERQEDRIVLLMEVPFGGFKASRACAPPIPKSFRDVQRHAPFELAWHMHARIGV